MYIESHAAPSDEVIVSGNVYFPQWRFSPPPDGIAAPTDAAFVMVMVVGLVLYLSLATAVLGCGMLWHAFGRLHNAFDPLMTNVRPVFRPTT